MMANIMGLFLSESTALKFIRYDVLTLTEVIDVTLRFYDFENQKLRRWSFWSRVDPLVS